LDRVDLVTILVGYNDVHFGEAGAYLFAEAMAVHLAEQQLSKRK
jgi:hypothetical protein